MKDQDETTFELYKEEMTMKELIQTLNNNNSFLISGFNAIVKIQSELLLGEINGIKSDVSTIKSDVSDIKQTLTKILQKLDIQ